jgi:mannose-6-phosphate isomerase-like protein (cupin superfamily)
MGKYAKYVNNLRLWTEVVRPSFRGKMADFSLMFDDRVYPDAPIWVETFYAFAPGTGAGVPGELPSFIEGKEHTKYVNGMQHQHDDFDELFLLFGTNPHDNTALGGEVEFWLGHGEDAQKFIARMPTAEWVPKGVAHNPHYFTKVNNPNLPVIMMVIAMTRKYSIDFNESHDYPVPPAFSFEKVGQEQPGKGKYTEFVNRLPLATDRVMSWQRGRVAVPTLVFDQNVYPAPVWVEIFHVYAGGTGVGTPALEPGVPPNPPGSEHLDMTKGFAHAHNFDELFLFIGTDPHDTLNLGGEVETWLGEGDEAEKFVLTEASSVFVPAGVVHNPQYFRRVDRPYLMVVIATVSDYFSNEIRWVPLPPAFKF